MLVIFLKKYRAFEVGRSSFPGKNVFLLDYVMKQNISLVISTNHNHFGQDGHQNVITGRLLSLSE